MPSSGPATRRALHCPRRLALAIAFLPVAATFFYIHQLCVNVPFQDDWEVVTGVQHMEAGRLHWDDIYRQHNEARIPVPESAYLLLAWVTRFDVRAEIYLSYACLLVSLGVLFLLFRETAAAYSPLYFLPISLLALGWRQHDTLLWGACLVNTMGLMFVLLAIYFASRRGGWLPFAAAAAAAALATFSVGSGMFAWPAALVCLARRRLAWIGVAAVTLAVYFDGYMIHRVPWPSGIEYVLLHPSSAAEYSLVYAGGALGGNTLQALIFGVAIVTLALAAFYYLVFERARFKAALPWCAIMLFMLLALGSLLSGRLGLGVAQAYSSRYATLAALWPIGVYGLFLVLNRRRWVAAVLVILGVGIVTGYAEGLREGRRDFNIKAACRDTLVHFRERSDQEVTCFYAAPAEARFRALVLEQLGLSVFRP